MAEATRYLVNDACVLLGKPNLYGAVDRFDGQVSVFYPRAGGPCYRCLFPEPPPAGLVPTCAEAGVLGVLPGVVGLLQATEAIKLILDAGQPLVGRLLTYSALSMHFRTVPFHRNPDCPVCGDSPTITSLVDHESAGSTCATTSEHVQVEEIDPRDLQTLLDRAADSILIDVRSREEAQVDSIPGSLCIPLAQLVDPTFDPSCNREATVVVYCQTGRRSAVASGLLRDRGFRRVLSLRGGIRSWQLVAKA